MLAGKSLLHKERLHSAATNESARLRLSAQKDNIKRPPPPVVAASNVPLKKHQSALYKHCEISLGTETGMEKCRPSTERKNSMNFTHEGVDR